MTLEYGSRWLSSGSNLSYKAFTAKNPKPASSVFVRMEA